MATSDTQSVATTLPARYYTDPDLFRDELERFYCQTWICAGRADQITTPGDYFLREVAGESIIITRDQSDALQAFFTTCAVIAARAFAPCLRDICPDGSDAVITVGPTVSTGAS
jgi:Rieske 2Fe-2S family protein